MTVAALPRFRDYAENGTTTEWALPWRFTPADIRAQRRAPDGTITALLNGTDFTVTGGDTDAGGILTTTAAAASGVELNVWSETARAQTADYTTSDRFPAETHELRLDILAMVAQEQDREIARAPQVARGATAPSIGALTIGHALYVDANGDIGSTENSTAAVAADVDAAEAAATSAAASEQNVAALEASTKGYAATASTAATSASSAAAAALAAGKIYNTTAAGVAANPSDDDGWWLINGDALDYYTTQSSAAQDEGFSLAGAAVVAAVDQSGTSWARPTIAAGRTAIFRDDNLRDNLVWTPEGWQDSAKVIRATPDFITAAIGAAPVFGYSMIRKFSSAYSGELFRVRRTSDSATLDCSSAAEAEAFAAPSILKVVGIYNQISGALKTFSTELDYVNVGGLPAAQNNTSGAINMLSSSALRSSFQNVPGIAGFYTAIFPEFGAPAANRDLFFVSTSSSSLRRVALQWSVSGAISCQSRRLDGDSAVSYTPGTITGGIESIGWNVNASANRARNTRNGRTIRDVALGGAGNFSNTTPNANINSDIPEGVTFFEVAAWNTAWNDTLHDALLADQLAMVEGNQSDIIEDGAATWWADIATRLPDSGNIAVGYGTYSGQWAAAEFNGETGARVSNQVLTEALHDRDEHLMVAPHVLDDGTLIAALLPHNFSISPGSDDQIRFFTSEDGTVASLALDTTFSSPGAGWNYGQWFESESNLFLLTNDDVARTWNAVHFPDKVIGDVEKGRALAYQASAPGGGQNQLYCRGDQDGDTVYLVFTAHPTNVQNPLRLMALDMEAGTSWKDTAQTDLGDPFTTGSNLATITGLPAIYTPPSGKSFRLMDMARGGDAIIGCEFDNPGDGSSGAHVMLLYNGGDRFASSGWDKISLPEDTGQRADSINYFPGACFSREDTGRGIRVFRTRNESSGAVQYLEQLDTRNKGASWRTNTLLTSDKVLRMPFPVKDAVRSGYAVAVTEGDYTDYQDFRLLMKLFRSA
ncbi:hypothetical protein [Aurantiacibacter zhengii]|uniref:Uncharacterized protein n=1 Tax=Aurantiacibacter zhengii TaxID=2307003 RepID=A0A418NU31_9SPHN|nr:hypothetical protein [Aurantiacibacter zhengii]RIV87509.1 hypothetical protein D2V07_03925 [Aurantiacibacter zhengii]